MPQLLESPRDLEEHEETTQLALNGALEWHAEDGYEYDFHDRESPWPFHYRYYHLELVIGRIRVIDATTLATEGHHSGKILVVWFDECERAIRYSREELENESDLANQANHRGHETLSWNSSHLGKSYRFGQPLGPPYRDDDETDY